MLHDGNTLAADRAVQKVCDYFFCYHPSGRHGHYILLLDFSSDKFVTYELNQMETNMVSAANDLEKQYTILQDVAHQIRSTYAYRRGC